MERYSREELQNIYLSLPQDLKEALFDVENTRKIYRIAKKYQIPLEKISRLADVVGRVLLGILSIEEFTDSLSLKLTINKDITENIIKDIREEIFQSVMDSLEKVQKESFHEAPPGPVLRPSAPPPSTISKPKPEPQDGRVVDLKNLPKD